MKQLSSPHKLFVRGIRLTIALVIVLSGLLAGAATPVLALDPVQTVELDGGHTVSFYGEHYDAVAGESTYFYSITSGEAPSVSHIVLRLECPPYDEGSSANLDADPVIQDTSPFVILDAGTWDYPDREALNSGEGHPEPSEFPSLPSQDGSTGTWGIKFNQGLSAGETLFFYFTLEGGFPPGPVRFIVKAGQTEPEAYILGPGCVVPGAVTVSSFEVQREDDTLRFKWTTETEINNRGFDLFAVEPNGDDWLRINESLIAPQGLGIEPQEYYYQVERSGLAIGSGFYLRAYDADGTHQDFGPVQAIYSASTPAPIAPAPPTVPVDRPIIEPRTDPVPLPEPIERDQPAITPALPIKEPGPPLPGPIVPRIEDNLRPVPIGRSLF